MNRRGWQKDMAATSSRCWRPVPFRPRASYREPVSPASLSAQRRRSPWRLQLSMSWRAGRDLDQIIVTTLLPAAVGETRREALDALRPGFAFYVGFFPRYNRMMAEHGFVEEAAAIAAAWSRGDRDAAERAVSDELIDA